MTLKTTPIAMQQVPKAPMDWLEIDFFCAVRAYECAGKNGYSNRVTVFYVRSVPRCYKQDD
jgi:hypothetical protein